MIFKIRRNYTSYQIAIFLSSLSMLFGILRECMIVGLLGLTAKNDELQIYLSIFYTVGLNIDAMRLSCLNLYQTVPLLRMLFVASLISIPFILVITAFMALSIHALNTSILFITFIGSYLNLMAALLITYKQRNNVFLPAQIINVIPNFILIPGILLCYFSHTKNIAYAIIILTSVIPIIQCILLLLLPQGAPIEKDSFAAKTPSLFSILLTFARHYSSMIGEQLFQIITRTAFYHYGPGYLSMYTLVVRLYSAFRFILIDSFIGSKLYLWKNREYPLLKKINTPLTGFFVASFTLIISIHTGKNLMQSAIQTVFLLIFGFYLSAYLRIIYFKINRQENNSHVILRFAIYELFFALLAFLLTQQLHYPVLSLLWLGYIARPFVQLLILKRAALQESLR